MTCTVAFAVEAAVDVGRRPLPRWDRVIIWAFCLRTSAGVRMKQETSSAVLEAKVWVRGVGRGVLVDRRCLTAS